MSATEADKDFCVTSRGKAWYALYCQPQKEFIAKTELANQGFVTYLPIYKKLVRHARQVREINAPLFPRYLFVSFDPAVDQWRAINSTRGIIGLVSFKHNINCSIPDQIITGLQRTHDESGLVSLAALELFQPGEQIRILEGAFAGLFAHYEKMTDKQRVDILIHFLNQDVRMQLPVYAIEKAA